MAQLLSGPFNALQYDPELGAPQFPLGMKQPMRIVSDEVVAAKSNGNNGYIAFTCEILDGPNKGAQGVYRLNVYHSSEKTVEISLRQLSALSIACGKPHWADTRELWNLPFLADVTPQKATEANEGKGYTEISQVYDVNGNKPKRGGATGQDQSQQQTNNQQQQTNSSGQNWNQNGNQSQNNGGGNQQQDNSQQQNQNQQQGNNGGNGQQWNQNQQQDNTNQQQQTNNQAPQNNSQTPPWMQKQG